MYKRPVLEMPSSQVPKFSSLSDELRDGRGVEGAGYVPLALVILVLHRGRVLVLMLLFQCWSALSIS